MRNKATIFDVAEKAGVSRGTVDRVIFNRGEVAGATADKVRRAIRALNYTADENASKLATKKLTRIGIIIPGHGRDDYWGLIERGFAQGRKKLSSYNVELDIRQYDPSDAASFVRNAEELIAGGADGLVINAAPKKALDRLREMLAGSGIPVAFIDNKDDSFDYLMYYGVDPYKSGGLGAFLLTMRNEVREAAIVRINRGDGDIYDPNIPRRDGIRDYLTDNCPGIIIHDVPVDAGSEEKRGQELDSFFLTHVNVRHIIFSDSRIHLIGKWLEEHPADGRIVIGYDDLDANLQALRDGTVDFLVTRKVQEQPSRLIVDFAQCIIHRKEPARKDNFVHMDILHRRNLDDY